MKRAATALFVALLVNSVDGFAADPIALRIVPDKRDYVLGEPIQMRVVFQNIADHVIYTPTLLSMTQWDMSFFWFEVTWADGHVEKRKTSLKTSYGMVGANSVGDSLLVGDGFVLYFYPVFLPLRKEAGGEWVAVERERTRTFDVPGVYTVRMCYEVPMALRRITTNEQRRVFSRPVTLRLRAPDAEEKEIIDALWLRKRGGGPPIGVMLGDDASCPAGYSQDALEFVSQKYSDNPLARHVWLALSKVYECNWWKDRKPALEEAIRLLERLHNENHDFRFYEVHLLLGDAYRYAERKRDAESIVREALGARPYLWVNRRFCGSAAAAGALGMDFQEWRERRKNGEFRHRLAE